jgi:hypothetical protein
MVRELGQCWIQGEGSLEIIHPFTHRRHNQPVHTASGWATRSCRTQGSPFAVLTMSGDE